MNHSITFKKCAVILAGLTLSATATIGHAQQQEMEAVSYTHLTLPTSDLG